MHQRDSSSRSSPNTKSNQNSNHARTTENWPSSERTLFVELNTKSVPPFKDYSQNLNAHQYLQQLEIHEAGLQPRHNQITQQNSSSTDEGCDVDDRGGRCFSILGVKMIQKI